MHPLDRAVDGKYGRSIRGRENLPGWLGRVESQAGPQAELVEALLVVRVAASEKRLRRREPDAQQDEQSFDAVAPGQLLALLAAARRVVDGNLVDPVPQSQD